MITGAIKNKVDKIWTDIWAGGITNPLTVIEQLTYLMFIRSLDEKELETEEFENMTGEKMDRIFPQSAAGQSMRWSKFKNNDPRDIYDVISQRVFPAIKNLKNGHLPDFNEQGELIEISGDSDDGEQNNTAFARYMDDAMFLIPTPQVLQKIITGLDDLYEHDYVRSDACSCGEYAFFPLCEKAAVRYGCSFGAKGQHSADQGKAAGHSGNSYR